jgi:hypothetical protein
MSASVDIRPSAGRVFVPTKAHTVQWGVGREAPGRLCGCVSLRPGEQFCLPGCVEVRSGERVWLREPREAKAKWRAA